MTLFYSSTRAIVCEDALCPQVRYQVQFLSLLLTISLLQMKVRGHGAEICPAGRSPGLESLILRTQRPCEKATTVHSTFPAPCQSLQVLQSSLARLSQEDAKHTYSWHLAHYINSDWERKEGYSSPSSSQWNDAWGARFPPSQCSEAEFPPPYMCLHVYANWDMIKGYLIFSFFIRKFSERLLEKSHWIMLGTWRGDSPPKI